MISELEDERRWARLREGILAGRSGPHRPALLPHLDSPVRVQGAEDRCFRRAEGSPGTDLSRPASRCPAPAAKAQGRPQALPPNSRSSTRRPWNELKRRRSSRRRRPSSSRRPSSPSRRPRSPFRTTRSRKRPRRRGPQAVPARPNFAMGSQNPADQLRQDMQNAMHGHGQQGYGNQPPGGLSRHPGAGTGGVQILSDTQGVDFSSWIAALALHDRAHMGPADSRRGQPAHLQAGRGRRSASRFCPTARLSDMVLEGRSGDTGLDRAAWGAWRDQAIHRCRMTSTAPISNCAPTSSTTCSRSKLTALPAPASASVSTANSS